MGLGIVFLNLEKMPTTECAEHLCWMFIAERRDPGAGGTRFRLEEWEVRLIWGGQGESYVSIEVSAIGLAQFLGLCFHDKAFFNIF